MSESLVFIRGSLIIKAIDAAGNELYLQEGVDYTYTYDGTGKVVENGKEVHVLDIEISHPQPVTYFLEYDTTLYIPTGTAESVKYQNSATITLWNKKITDTSTERIYPYVTVASNYFAVLLHKLSNTKPTTDLANAEFGIFNEHGGLIMSKTTGDDGRILFETDVTNGVILREHELYYLQEISAPKGYKLDETKHWFCFCSNSGGTCDIYQELVGEEGLVRIPFENVGHIDITNELLVYDLPATGGTGTYPLMLVSVIFIITPLVYRFVRRRKRERRGIG
jgi:LPXTG-motif cell wall-anchored protein